MVTVERSVAALSGEVCFSLAAQRFLRASVVRCAPRFRIFRGLRIVAHLQHLKHPGLSAVLRHHWHVLRAHSSYSRA